MSITDDDRPRGGGTTGRVSVSCLSCRPSTGLDAWPESLSSTRNTKRVETMVVEELRIERVDNLPDIDGVS